MSSHIPKENSTVESVLLFFLLLLLGRCFFFETLLGRCLNVLPYIPLLAKLQYCKKLCHVLLIGLLYNSLHSGFDVQLMAPVSGSK